MAESKVAPKKAPAKKPAVKTEAPKLNTQSLIRMVRDDGKEANVHPIMVDDYKSGGYKEV